MNRLVRHISVILTVILAVSCSDHTFTVEDRPASERQDDIQLADPAMRICGDALTLRYDDGGVLFSRTGNGVVSAVRVDDGASFEYDTVSGRLKINGADVAVASSELLKRDGTAEWHRVTLSDNTSVIYIVFDL